MSATHIKLFGKTICFSESSKTHFDSIVCDDYGKEKKQSLSLEDAISSSSSVSYKDLKNPGESVLTKQSGSSNTTAKGLKNPTSSTDYPKTPSFETEPDLQNDLTNDHSESNSGNTPQKPDKILPCPRCNSSDTKFCYYNNYNLTQPRYFCKNCQRYWTSGGTMRNVPVGSGRRKNKINSDSRHCQMMVPESFQPYQDYAKVLDFGSNSQTNPCDFLVMKPNLGDKLENCFRNGLHGPERKEFSDETSSSSLDNGGKKNFVFQESAINNFQNFSPMMFYQSHSPGVWSFPCFYSPNSNSQILGKHSRERETLSVPEENNLWFPKASRIDYPREAARSDYSQVLQANPAALARSHNFHENE